MIKVIIKWNAGVCDARCQIDGVCYISPRLVWSPRQALEDLEEAIRDRTVFQTSLFNKEFIVIHE